MKSTLKSSVAKQGPSVVEKGRPVTSTGLGMKSSKSSSSLVTEARLTKLKRASSDDALAKPGLSAALVTSRLKKTMTSESISELADSKTKVISGVQPSKRSGIPAPRELPSPISRDRLSLRDQFRTTSNRKMLTNASASSISTLAKQSRISIKSKAENESNDKALLECQVKELLAEAKAKEFEISRLRSELKRCKEQGLAETSSPEAETLLTEPAEPQALVKMLREKNRTFQRELAGLREENQGLKEKLIKYEQSTVSSSNGTNSSLSACASSPTKQPINGVIFHNIKSPLKKSASNSSDLAKSSPSPDSSEFENILDISSRTESDSSSANKPKNYTNQQPLQNTRELSVESLTEQIQKMEESHHSTAEELQATLQELSDQQQVIQELTAENERLAEEKSLLQSSLHQQRERMELMMKKNEALKSQLQEKCKSEEAEDKTGRINELEQRYAEQVERSRFEREKLVDIQQQLTSSLRSLEKEHLETQGLIKNLRDENECLQRQLQAEKEARIGITRTLDGYKSTTEALKLENGRFQVQLDIEKQKVTELKAMHSASDNSELDNLLKVAHCEKEKLDVVCTELRSELLTVQNSVTQLQEMLAKVEAERQQLKKQCELQQLELNTAAERLKEQASKKEAEMKDLKETIFELEDQVEQHQALKLHSDQTITDLENRILKLEEQKMELEKQQKTLNKQMKDDTEEWKRFQADLQTAVVVANDIKIEAQQEVRALRRRLQEEEERSTRLTQQLEEFQGIRLKKDEVCNTEVDTNRNWYGISLNQTSPASLDSTATVKSLIKSFDTGFQSSSGHTVQIHPAPRSPLSGIPIRTAPAAAVSPIQRQSSVSMKLFSKTIGKRINLGDPTSTDSVSGQSDDIKPTNLMRKSPSLESVIKSPSAYAGRSFSKAQSKLSVERKDPLAALAREYGGSKRNALLRWCQKKTEGYPNIDVTNFSSSWSDGLAFCALLHTYLPAHIPYHDLTSQDKNRNLTLAFQAAESVGIKPSLDIAQVMHTDRPDWQAVMQYVTQIYKYFET
ncbi:cytospin-B isoform X1 [Polypterus senegalus]|uniref:cytospin-B isoform X1 n=1 Tax=Polypterus senegalus TaxID=55291 RepID=UPI001965DBAC|nr:cytospin-B isoform X1 [Polypterus senegalus]XP_039612983.1 cytospin-B isoform X1 [Polypterus senegalus]XP_039612984.1 cytospin-B isoform X1 [Polypterus senegalus]XP_039612985.1 cytospin-B isoform X1 [Polypterus senegalus]